MIDGAERSSANAQPYTASDERMLCRIAAIADRLAETRILADEIFVTLVEDPRHARLLGELRDAVEDVDALTGGRGGASVRALLDDGQGISLEPPSPDTEAADAS